MTFIVYGLGFLLFWEWLRPIPLITNTSHVDVFVMFAAFAFLLTYLQLPFWLSAPAKAAAILFSLHMLFYYGPLLDPGWLTNLLHHLLTNAGHLLTLDFTSLSDVFRSFLFFVLLWLISYLMYYWLIQARTVLLFFFSTVVYITIIDTFTLYDASGAIVRVVVIGFALLGLLRFVKLREEERMNASFGMFPATWAVVMAAVLLLTTVVGFAAPKAGPQWPDPVPFLKSAAGVGPGGTLRRIGYDSNDERLGGPFLSDNDPLFTVATKERSYWRVESKSIYTGKGWVSTDTPLVKVNFDRDPAPELYNNENVTVHEKTAKIVFEQGRKFPQLVYGGEITDIKANGVQFLMDENTQKIQPYAAENPVTLQHYTLSYNVPEFTEEQLKKSVVYPPAIEPYLQLPKSLPEKVKTLTESITKDAANAYDKAKAVERYLHTAGFEYNTEDVAVPAKNQDYVAQFLFETKQGYCDNFSSAMAVMLRTIGIPTRWVKGFTPGDYKDSLPNGKTVFQVTNANAHSWVEVYFPNVGWVPFEPTKGFRNAIDIVKKKDESPDETATGNDSNDTATDLPEQNQRNPQLIPRPNENEQASSGAGTLDRLTMSNTGIIIGVILLLLAAGAAYWKRKLWLPRLLRLRYLGKNDEDTFQEAYEQLLKLLPLFGLTRGNQQTLREFAVKVDQALGTVEMKELTVAYERLAYRGGTSSAAWQETKVMWDTIIKRLMAE
ncbi:MAG TPA: transglutaminase domain-containing protein [Bacillales bacterium]|nr:transglutaminase domain-containing protein [Bacillales bacterium]